MTGTDGLACAAFLDQAGWVLLLCFLIGGIWTVGVPLRSWWHDRAAMRASGHKPEETGAAGRLRERGGALPPASGRILPPGRGELWESNISSSK